MERSALSLLLLPGIAAAQSPCPDLHIASIGYSAFDGGLLITLHNGSLDFLSYPYFDVIDDSGDTIAFGAMNFFGIAAGTDQQHLVTLDSGTATTPFTGELLLHYIDVNGEGSCLFDVVEADLCPADSCIDLQVFAFNSSPIDSEFPWTVTDSTGGVLASGTLVLEVFGSGTAFNDLCLPPGAYTLNIAQPVAAGTNLTVGLTQDEFAVEGEFVPLPVGGSIAHPFEYYIGCVDAAQGTITHAIEPPLIVLDGRLLRVTGPGMDPPGALGVLDATGRVVRTTTPTGTTTTIALDGLSAGAYLLRSLDPVVTWPAQRFILH